jgi:UDP-N-acetylmuramate--alanine ligase
MENEESFHFIGIGGIGMSALARILAQKGHSVSGSDLSRSYVTDQLEKEGIRLFFTQVKENVPESATIVYSTDIPKDNPELQEAKRRALPLLHRSDLLSQLSREGKPLLVAGTHGKTTTSSLLAHVLMEARLDPSFAIGGIVRSLGTNGRHGLGPYFVVEADESDGSFLKYAAYGAIITNIDNDHMTYWKSGTELLAGFRSFADHVLSKEHLFWCLDDGPLASLQLEGISYGFHRKAALQIENDRQEGWTNVFDVSFEGKKYAQISSSLIGRHNVLNASAVFGLSLRLGVPESAIRKAFATFQGVGRRAERKGSFGSVEIYDDYAHHPTEISTTLSALKQAVAPKRLVVVFQPHRYTRTRDCLAEYPAAFADADELILTDIYSAGEAPIEGISTGVLLEKISALSSVRITHITRRALPEFLASFLQPEDALITMGAGDVTKVGPELLSRWRA